MDRSVSPVSITITTESLFTNAQHGSKNDRLFLTPDDSWLQQFEEGRLGYKKMMIYTEMAI